MALTGRKFNILEAIVTDYIRTAEPVSSRTIAKKYGLGISPATIRNEMSDLEDMGYITQPHASAGRIPSEKGYRLYVDSMMLRRALTHDETLLLQRMMIDNINQIEYMMEETAKAISRLTNYPAIISEPRLEKTKIRHVQLLPLDEKAVVLVLVTDTKAVKNQVVHLQAAPDYTRLTQLSFLLNRKLKDKAIRQIDRATVDALLESFNGQAYVLLPVLDVMADMIQAEDNVRVFASGVKNMLAFPEFADVRKATAIFQALEERDVLITLLGQAPSEGIQIVIGNENPVEPLKGCSVIKANYSIDRQSTGCIGVIGPTRMDYAQTVSVLEGILLNINCVIRALSNEQ